MAKYLDEEQAKADGITIVHQPHESRFALISEVVDETVAATNMAAATGESQPQVRNDLVGVAHYTLIGEDAIDFDHTLVIPSFRGTGLSELLAERALTDQIVQGRRIQASCWYIAEYLEKNPHLNS